MGNRAVFLDRDGTINRDVHYCSRVEDFELLHAIPQAIKLLNENGFKVVVITNQSGIAREYFTEETLSQIHQKMRDELVKYSAWVDAIYYYPHHPNEECDCRKPKTALFCQAARDLNIDFELSYIIGDLVIDVDAGRVLGCKTVLFTTGPSGGNDVIDLPNYTASNLLEAARWITKDTK